MKSERHFADNKNVLKTELKRKFSLELYKEETKTTNLNIDDVPPVTVKLEPADSEDELANEAAAIARINREKTPDEFLSEGESDEHERLNESRFEYESDIDSTISTTDLQSRSMYACDQCGRCYFSQGALSAHKQMHFFCKICKKTFKRKDNLRKYMIFHIENPEYKPFICKNCGVRFRSQHNFTTHQCAETICDECGKDDKTFEHSIIKFTGDHRFVCELCNNTFKRETNYNTHKSKYCPKIFGTGKGIHDENHTKKLHYEKVAAMVKEQIEKVNLKKNETSETNKTEKVVAYEDAFKAYVARETVKKLPCISVCRLKPNLAKKAQPSVKMDYEAAIMTHVACKDKNAIEMQTKVQQHIESTLKEQQQQQQKAKKMATNTNVLQVLANLPGTVVQNPVENRVQNPVQNPVENRVQNPVQNSVENPVQNPVQNPVENPVQYPVQKRAHQINLNKLSSRERSLLIAKRVRLRAAEAKRAAFQAKYKRVENEKKVEEN